MKLLEKSRRIGFIALIVGELLAIAAICYLFGFHEGTSQVSLYWSSLPIAIVLLLAASFVVSRDRIRYLALLSACAALLLAIAWPLSFRFYTQCELKTYKSNNSDGLSHSYFAETGAGGIRLYHHYFATTSNLKINLPTDTGLNFTINSYKEVAYPYANDQSNWLSYLSIRTNSFTLANPGGRVIILESISFSYWLPLCLCLPFPAFYFIRLYRQRRHQPGHCKKCGYDLRASPEKCPECGMDVPVHERVKDLEGPQTRAGRAI